MDNQHTIDDCIRRVRNARNVGMSPEHVCASMGKEFTIEALFLAWHAACILDPFTGFQKTDKVSVPPSM